VDQTSATTPAAAPAQSQDESRPPEAGTTVEPPGFGSRGRVRRRARFLRKARELAYRDLGGLVFNLHRFGQRNDALVIAKLDTLGHIDAELRALEAALSEREPVTILREAGITACPRCAAIHGGEDRFCPNCGLSLSRNSNLPIAGAAPAAAAAQASASASAPSAPAPAAAAAAAPATAAHTPAPAPTAPAAPPAPSPPSPAPEPPATQTFSPVAPATQGDPGAPAGGRSPKPPAPSTPAPPGQSAPAGEEDQPTEIIRPPTAGS
jgi:hypothetical protein